MIAFQNLCVHGVTIGAKLIPMAADGVAPEKMKTVYIDGDGVPHECLTAYLYDDAILYVMDTIYTAQDTIYDFSGTCAPGSLTVYIGNPANAQGGTYKQMFASAVISSTQADADGAFAFTGIPGVDGELTVWIEVSPNYIDTASVSFDVESTRVNPDAPVKENLVYATFDPLEDSEVCPECQGVTGTMEACGYCAGTGLLPEGSSYRVSVRGTCPSDAGTVKISAMANAGDTFTGDALTNAVVQTCTASGGNYSTTGRFFDSSVKYVVWCYTATETAITAEASRFLEESGSGDEPTCLSGDTLISMADGSVKQMQDVAVGDRVISQNGEAVLVQQVARGHYNNCHTLYYFADGTVIDETHEHRFYNVEQGFFQRLRHWNVGEHAVGKDGKHVALTGKTHIDEPAEMFGIWTEDGTYFANGLLSGAAFCNKPLLENASAEKAVDMVLSADEEKIWKLMGLERWMV